MTARGRSAAANRLHPHCCAVAYADSAPAESLRRSVDRLAAHSRRGGACCSTPISRMAMACSVGTATRRCAGWVAQSREGGPADRGLRGAEAGGHRLMGRRGPRRGGVPRSRLRRGPGRPGQREPGSSFAEQVELGSGPFGGPLFLVAPWVAKRVMPGRFLVAARYPNFHKLNA